MNNIVEIWTDGGWGPAGPGGWGALLSFKGVEKELYGGEKETTNNRMELTAACYALEALTRPCKVILSTDSEYVKNGITKWAAGWVKNNWKGSSGKAIANVDLWKKLIEASSRHEIEWRWVKGHSGNENNERVDKLATRGREELV